MPSFKHSPIKLKNCFAQLNQGEELTKSFTMNNQKVDTMMQNACDKSSLRKLKTQLDYHERLYKRYTCGELSRSNRFCRHLDNMKDTRHSLLKQLEQIDLSRVAMSSTL